MTTNHSSGIPTPTSPDRPPEPKYWYVPEEAERPIKFIESKIKYIEGDLTGEDVRLEDWQKDLLRQFFGWFKRDRKGRVVRKYKKLYLEIPRKNNKTTFTSWLVTFVLFCEGEQRGQVYAAAASEEQADILFEFVKEIILGSPALASRCKVRSNSIFFPLTKTIFKSLSAKAGTKHGFNASCFVVDEVHAQPDRKLIDVLTTGNGTRKQPIEIYITTAGTDRDSICWILHQHAQMVIKDPDFDPTFLARIFAAEEDDDWTDPKIWEKANPMLGKSINWEKLEEDFAKIASDPTFEITFKQLYLNIWTEAANEFIPSAVWMKCALDYGERALFNQVAYGGMDLSTKIDFTAFALAFDFDLKDGTDRRALQLLRWLFRPKGTLKAAEKRDHKPYFEWMNPQPNFERGLFEATPGRVIDYSYIRTRILEILGQYRVKCIGFDPWHAQQIAQELQDQGDVLMIEMRQGMKTMSEPTKEFHALAIDERLRHQGDRAMQWMLAQSEVEKDKNNNWQLTKAHGNARIDGIVASIMAVGCAINDSEDDFEDHYKNSGGIFG